MPVRESAARKLSPEKIRTPHRLKGISAVMPNKTISLNGIAARASSGYAEIFEIYGQRIASAAKEVIERIDKEKEFIGDGELVFTADKCEPITEEVNLNGKIVVIDSDVFSPEYQIATHQLMLCTGGFGAQPNARGRSCFCTSLYDGHDTKFYRQDIIGIIAAEELPEWAKSGYDKAVTAQKKAERNER